MWSFSYQHTIRPEKSKRFCFNINWPDYFFGNLQLDKKLRNRTCQLIVFTFHSHSSLGTVGIWIISRQQNSKILWKPADSRLTLEKVSKRRYVFLVIAPNVGRHAFLDRWRNAQKDGQGDQVRDRGEHSFTKLKVTYNQFLAWLKRTKKEQIVQWKRNGDL